ncbi:MAG: DUF692 family multinuclear iron-containing protein [Candidatus Binatia bacterium]
MHTRDEPSQRSAFVSGPTLPKRPALATTYAGQDPALLARMLPLVEYIEVTPDSIAMIDHGRVTLHAPTMRELRAIGRDAHIIVHGIGLSLGSHDGYSEQYLHLLEELLGQVEVAWHSEHLGYTMVDGEYLGTMLALPRTEQVLDMLCERIYEIQERYPLPFLIENIVHLLPPYEEGYSSAAFLNALADRTGCGLLLDVYNLECDAYNHAFDIPAFLAELDLQPVREIHVARGVEHKGFLLDVHSRCSHASTLALAQEVIQRGEQPPVLTYELLPQAVPVLGHDTIVEHLNHLAHTFRS